MTQEEKDWLLKDLCTRLPYKPQIKFSLTDVEGYEVCELLPEIITSMFFNEDIEIKPYLRPMSSMTEDECKELGNLPAIIENVGETLPNIPYYIEVVSPEQFDWLNKNMFDWRGLIPMGLALEASEGMYNIK